MTGICPGSGFPRRIAVTGCAARRRRTRSCSSRRFPRRSSVRPLTSLADHVPGRGPVSQRRQGDRERDVRAAEPDHRRDAGASPGRGPERAQSRGRAGAWAARLGGRRRCVGGAQPSRARGAQPRGLPGLHQPRRGRRRSGRGAQEHPGDRRGHLRRPGLRRQRQGGTADAGPGGDHPDGRLPGRTPVHVLRPGRGRRRGHDLLQPVRAEPLGRRADRPGGDARDRSSPAWSTWPKGVATTRSVHALARKRQVEMPITAEVHQVLFEGKSPRSAVTDLMVRLPKVEWDT